MKYIAVVLFLLCFAVSTNSQVLIYRQLPLFPIPQVFKVEVRQGANPYQPVYTYGIPNVAGEFPKIVDELALKWQQWAIRTFVVPKPGKKFKRPAWAKPLAIEYRVQKVNNDFSIIKL